MTHCLSRRCFLTSAGGTAFVMAAPVHSNSRAAAHRDLQPIVQPSAATDAAMIERAFEMRRQALDRGDQPFGAVIVRAGKIVGQSWSRVVLDDDPTAHAEMAAIRDASRRLASRDLGDAVLYSSSRPCPMCESAAYWAGIGRMIFGRAAVDAGPPGLGC